MRKLFSTMTVKAVAMTLLRHLSGQSSFPFICIGVSLHDEFVARKGNDIKKGRVTLDIEKVTTRSYINKYKAL